MAIKLRFQSGVLLPKDSDQEVVTSLVRIRQESLQSHHQTHELPSENRIK